MIERYTFAQLRARLDAMPDQEQGLPGDVCQAGEMYREFFVTAMSRPGDVAVVEDAVAANVLVLLDQYFLDREGRIYWHTPLEWDISESPLVMEYRDDGPDTEIITNERCVLDKDWWRVGCYTRLYRAKHKSAGDV